MTEIRLPPDYPLDTVRYYRGNRVALTLKRGEWVEASPGDAQGLKALGYKIEEREGDHGRA